VVGLAMMTLHRRKQSCEIVWVVGFQALVEWMEETVALELADGTVSDTGFVPSN